MNPETWIKGRDEAETVLDRVRPESHNDLATVPKRQGTADQAIVDYQEALGRAVAGIGR